MKKKFKIQIQIQKKERKERKKEEINMSTTTTLQELLLQREEYAFIPDEMDDKFYDNNIYNWEVMFETVKLFVIKEGRWPRMHREEDKRNVIMADGSIVLRDLARWMSNQRQKVQGEIADERERKLNSIRFMWDKWEHEWHAMFCAVKRFKEKGKRWPRRKIRQRTSERWCWQMVNQC